MKQRRWMTMVSIFSIVLFHIGAMAAANESDVLTFQGQRHIKGTVEQIKGGQLQLNTGEMAPRFIPLKAAKEKGFPKIKIGDVIELTLNDQNLLVDYHLLNKSGHPVGHIDHQILKGQIAQPLVIGHKRALIRTEDGKETSYQIRTQARSKMASIPVGADAIFMVDETNRIVDVNFVSKEAAERAAQMPEQKSPLKGAQQRMLGTVITPLQESRITIRTRNGEEKDFEVRPSMRKRMAALPKGEKIVLLLDGDNQVADIAVPPGQKGGE
jgi:translation initiation factor IF-1